MHDRGYSLSGVTLVTPAEVTISRTVVAGYPFWVNNSVAEASRRCRIEPFPGSEGPFLPVVLFSLLIVFALSSGQINSPPPRPSRPWRRQRNEGGMDLWDYYLPTGKYNK